jgi:hypothetical protein
LPVKTATAKRLIKAEEQFHEIERLTKELRKRLDVVAETVRVAAQELLRGDKS